MPKLIKQITAQAILEAQLINLCSLWEKEKSIYRILPPISGFTFCGFSYLWSPEV